MPVPFPSSSVVAIIRRPLPCRPALLRADGAPPEVRRILAARLPGRPSPAVTAVLRALTAA
ncbi:hypothetical protein ABZW58_17680 [Streptomyces cellulosae]